MGAVAQDAFPNWEWAGQQQAGFLLAKKEHIYEKKK